MHAYLDEEFLGRVRRAYRAALAIDFKATGPIWSAIDARRADVHAALLDDTNTRLRQIFADPTSTDLYYGCDRLSRSLVPVRPEYFVEEALKAGRGLDAKRQADRVADLLDKTTSSSVVEIGPGMGRIALFAFRAGIADYTTIDLPLGLVAQACFLGRVLGPDKLWFDGEAAENSAQKIKLYSAARLPARHYGVAINVDSMTEVPWREAFRYACWLGEHARLFFSINHERHVFTVAELMAFAGMTCCQRSVVRDLDGYESGLGYREEVYGLRRSRLKGARRRAFHLFLSARSRARHIRRLAQTLRIPATDSLNRNH